MTEKRFTLVDDYLIEYDGDYFDLHKPSDIRSLVNIIKYITDENEQLKHECNYLQNRLDDFINVQNENEQLKSEIKDLNDILARYEEKELEND